MKKTPIRHYPVTPAELGQVQSILPPDIAKADYRFFCHLLAYSLRQWKRLQRESLPGYEGGGWIPLSRRFIDDGFYVGKGAARERANPQKLKELGLIDIHDKYKPEVSARKYRIPPGRMEGFVTATLSEPITTDSSRLDLMTGKPWNEKWVVPSSLDEEDLNEAQQNARMAACLLYGWDVEDHPRIKKAIESIRECHYNRDALVIHLEKRRRDYQDAMDTEENLQAIGFSRAARLRRRLINDISIFRELPSYSPFQPVYTPQASGRIGSPMQNLTREAKAAAYSGFTELYNYDLSASQLRILRFYEFPRYGLDCPWLADYLDDHNARASKAEAIGVSPEAFKEAVIGVVMGGRLPRDRDDRLSPILQTLDDGLREGQSLDDAAQRFNEEVAPLKRELGTWHMELWKQLKQEGGIKNALGLSLRLEKVERQTGGSKRGTVAAFILQGSEALFIHTLTTLSGEYGFQVIGNEHDGLITIGQIPQAAIHITKEQTGLQWLELREKPFEAQS